MEEEQIRELTTSKQFDVVFRIWIAFIVVITSVLAYVVKRSLKRSNTILIVGLCDSGKTMLFSKLINASKCHKMWQFYKISQYRKNLLTQKLLIFLFIYRLFSFYWVVKRLYYVFYSLKIPNLARLFLKITFLHISEYSPKTYTSLKENRCENVSITSDILVTLVDFPGSERLRKQLFTNYLQKVIFEQSKCTIIQCSIFHWSTVFNFYYFFLYYIYLYIFKNYLRIF